jgi:2-oxoglutarate dehydrogenase E2 component (dihydrolipoamide succinyltransferase)
MSTTDILAPAEQEGTKAVVRGWLRQVGDTVRANDPVVELETDKVAVEIAATRAGVLSEILVEEGGEVLPGTVLGRIADAASAVGAKHAAAPSTPTQQRPAPKGALDAAAIPPGIRRLLAEHGLDARDVPTSGAKITREDVLAEAERRANGPAPARAAGVVRVPHDAMRKRIAEHLTHSIQTAPHVTALFEADLSAVIAHRDAHKTAFEHEGASLTFTAYFVAASAAAMKAAPAVNGRWYEDRIEIYEHVNIGVGTALGEKGLIVPVIAATEKLSLLEVARRLSELTEKARAGKLAPEDVRGGTFSISNHGVSGSLLAAPIIINQPQAAILGIGKLEKRAVVRQSKGEDRIEIRPMAYVTLTIDHRVIDAFQTNAWLTSFVNTLETWPAS